ncbi:MAG TPA: hypothetical protein PK977_09130 [Chitinophagaceae bacterium]|nr:hypothetical protein [Chitinophagaceae bacterium]
MLERANPSIAADLFAPGRMTFEDLYTRYRKGMDIAQQQKASFDVYRDKINTQIAYLNQQKELLDSGIQKQLISLKSKMSYLDSTVSQEEAVESFIKERKRELIDKSVQVLGRNKHLQKITKESFYYVETIRNYKELFSDPSKAEVVAKDLLAKVPAFREFFQRNSMLASLFNRPPGQAMNVSGLQTRSSIQDELLSRIGGSGPNASSFVSQQMASAQAEMNKLKQRVLANGSGSGDADMPNFKPNNQKTKTFGQRLEYGFNVQFNRSNRFVPSAVNVAANIGFKLNDKASTGVGMAYRAGIMTNSKFRLSHEGLGLRSYFDWKLKRQFFISGGYELNQYPAVQDLLQPGNVSVWQKSALIGLSKKVKSSSKFTKNAKLQLLYDLLHRRGISSGPALIYRIGYEF